MTRPRSDLGATGSGKAQDEQWEGARAGRVLLLCHPQPGAPTWRPGSVLDLLGPERRKEKADRAPEDALRGTCHGELHVCSRGLWRGPFQLQRRLSAVLVLDNSICLPARDPTSKEWGDRHGAGPREASGGLWCQESPGHLLTFPAPADLWCLGEEQP